MANKTANKSLLTRKYIIKCHFNDRNDEVFLKNINIILITKENVDILYFIFFIFSRFRQVNNVFDNGFRAQWNIGTIVFLLHYIHNSIIKYRNRD